MSIFEDFQNPDIKKLFDVFKYKFYDFLKKSESFKQENEKVVKALKETEIDYKKISEFRDNEGKKIGNICEVTLKVGNDIRKNSEILILTQDEDGYFYNGFREKMYSPWVVFDKFLSEEEASADVEEESDNEKVVIVDKEKDAGKDKEKILDLKGSIILPGYYLAILTYLMSIICSIENSTKKKTSAENDFVQLSLINTLSNKLGVYKFKLHKIDKIRSLWVKVPVFFEPENLNYIERKTNPYKVVYPSEKVSESIRLPNDTQTNIFDMLETPESEKIGLNLTLVDSDNLSYELSSLNFKPKILEIDENYSLSYATKQIPFLLHSDGARVLMGAKNLKQAVKVVKAEKPIVFTGNEGGELGVNALIAYGLYHGFNFEDGIVVSSNFAEKMKVVVQEKEYFTIKTKNVKSPEKVGTQWRYGNKEILWKVKSGSVVEYGDLLFIEKEGGKEFLHRYTGKYTAEVKQIPDKPEIPVKKRDSNGENNEYYIKIGMLFNVVKPLEVGDKIMGRHGNKGTVSLILDNDQMPKATIGGENKVLDMLLSPLGVVSRMNLGQLYEVHASLAHPQGKKYGPFFNGYDEKQEILKKLKLIGSDDFGRFAVSGYENRLVCGYQYFVRLDHCVRDKIHFVSSAKESELICQPLKGKSRNGGQKIGEMEFWTLLSYNNMELVHLFKGLNSVKKPVTEAEDVYLEILRRAGVNIKTDGFKTEVCAEAGSNKKYSRVISEIFKNSISNRWALKYIYDEQNADKEEFINVLNAFREKNEQSIKNKLKELDGKVFNELKGILEKYSSVLKVIIREKDQTIGDDDIDAFCITPEKRADSLIKDIIEKLEYTSAIKKQFKSLSFQKSGYARSYVVARRIHNSGRAVITPQPRTEYRKTKLTVDDVILPIEFGIEMLKTLESEEKDFLPQVLKEDALKGSKEERKKVSEKLNELFAKRWPDRLVILNRQPSLIRHSMQSFYPKFWENYTIGLPILVCQGFNADFDGDTMAVYFPAIWNEKIKAEAEKMLPSNNPFSMSNSDLNYSIDQDIVYGKYLVQTKNKEVVKADIKKDINGKNAQEIKIYLNDLMCKTLKDSTEKSMTLGIYEIQSNNDECSSMFKIRESQCRGKKEQYNQLYKKIDDKKENFLQGISAQSYYNVKNGVAARARRTLMDKKLHVADAGYFTRKLTEFLGSIYVDSNFKEYFEIDLKSIGKIKIKSYGKGKIKSYRKIKIKSYGKGKIKSYGKPENFIMYRYVKVDGKELFVDASNFNEIVKVIDKVKLLSPGIRKEKDNTFRISGKYLGKDISTLKSFSDGEMIGITAGHVLGERGTQLSMETFHSGSRGLNMNSISSYILSQAFEETEYMDFLYKLQNYEQNSDQKKKNKSDEVDMLQNYEQNSDQKKKNKSNKVDILNKINPYSIYFEILYNFARFIKTELKIKSFKKFVLNTELRGFLTCLTFESSDTVMKNVMDELQNKKVMIFNETHPRVNYSFFRRDEDGSEAE